MNHRSIGIAIMALLCSSPVYAELVIDQAAPQQPVTSSTMPSRQMSSRPDASWQAVSSNAVSSNSVSSNTPSVTSSHRSFDPIEISGDAPSAYANTAYANTSASDSSSSFSAPSIKETVADRSRDRQIMVSGWADAVPLDLALAQVIPSDWSIWALSVDGSKLVSWSGGKSWLAVLNDLANRGDFMVEVVWETRQVVVYRPGRLQPSKSEVAMARSVRSSIALATSPSIPTYGSSSAAVDPLWSLVPKTAPESPSKESRQRFSPAPPSDSVISSHGRPVLVSVEPMPALHPSESSSQMSAFSPKVWKLDPHLTLHQNVDAWAVMAGWNKVVWEAADYGIVAPATFEGDFVSESGPLAKLIEAYSKSDQPLQVRLSTMDKVVHVTNKNYQPAVATPLSPQQIVPSSMGEK